MNKKYLIYSFLIMFLMVCKPSFSMGGKVFKLARAVGVGTLPTFGLYKAYKRNETIQEEHKKVNPITDESLQKWFQEQKEQLNISNAESISLVKKESWASLTDKKNSYVTLSGTDAFILNNALIGQPEAEKVAKEYSTKLEDLRLKKATHFDEMDDILIKMYESLNDSNNKLIDLHKSTIARDSMILKHELGHIVHKDTQRDTYTAVAIPVGVEALSFGVTKAFRKLCNIQQQPKTLLKTMLRSCSAIGAIGPKSFMNGLGIVAFSRYKETRADKFACENAESRLELEEFANFFRERENAEWASKSRNEVRLLEYIKDPMHPAFIDRREMVESYLPKWDREHSGEKS